MTRAKAKAKPKEYLSQSERAGLEDEKREVEVALKQAESYGEGKVDTSSLRAEVKRLDDAIEERTAPVARGMQKDKLAVEEKELEDKIAAGMPTWFEMRKPSMNPGAVRKHMQWCDRNQANIERYRVIQKILRPMEPKSIENLRKEK